MRSVKANTSFWDVIWISSSQIYIKILILKNFNKLDLMVRNSKAVIPSLKFQISSVAQSCPTLCDPMDCSTLGFPVHHQLLELTQTHVHGVGNAIQPSHPLLPPSPSAFNLSRHQGLFQWVSSSIQVAKLLQVQPQSQPFQWIFKTDFL